MTCAHSPQYPTTPPTLAEAAAACSFTTADTSDISKAATLPVADDDGNALRYEGRTVIARSFYDSLGEPEKAAAIAHERGHVLLGMHLDCECCADKIGGYLMRCWGFTPQLASRAMGNVVSGLAVNCDGQPRDAAGGAMEGAKAAEGLAPRVRHLDGLLSLGRARVAPLSHVAVSTRPVRARAAGTTTAAPPSPPLLTPVIPKLPAFVPGTLATPIPGGATTLDPGGPGSLPPGTTIEASPPVGGFQPPSVLTQIGAQLQQPLVQQVIAGVIVAVILMIALKSAGAN